MQKDVDLVITIIIVVAAAAATAVQWPLTSVQTSHIYNVQQNNFAVRTPTTSPHHVVCCAVLRLEMKSNRDWMTMTTMVVVSRIVCVYDWDGGVGRKATAAATKT